MHIPQLVRRRSQECSDAEVPGGILRREMHQQPCPSQPKAERGVEEGRQCTKRSDSLPFRSDVRVCVRARTCVCVCVPVWPPLSGGV